MKDTMMHSHFVIFFIALKIMADLLLMYLPRMAQQPLVGLGLLIIDHTQTQNTM
jgi:hypothetical protein